MTIHYYKSSIEKLIATVKKNVCDISTNDIRCYLAEQQEQRGLSKVTIDNLRRIYSSFSLGLKMRIILPKVLSAESIRCARMLW